MERNMGKSIVFAAVLCISGNLFAYSGGDGLSVATAYRISTPDDWAELMQTPGDWTGKYFVLTEDIDLMGIQPTPVGNSTTPFSGIFDGGQHMISRVIMNMPTTWYVGLFGLLSADAEIKNLGVSACYIFGFNYIGGLAAYNHGTIRSCYVAGTVFALPGLNVYQGTIGGLVGCNLGTIDSCHAAAAVSNADRLNGIMGHIGGLVGVNGGTVNSSYATGNVSGKESNTGGLVGYTNAATTITDCYAAGAVSATGLFTITGGLVGYSATGVVITACHTTGAVSGSEGTGGLVGFCESATTITDCYTTGTVNGNYNEYVGGLIGYCNAGSMVTDCYTTGNVSGDSYVGGVAGYSDCMLDSCYASGNVSGTIWVGGLVGKNSGTVTSCFATGGVLAWSDGGGLAGESDGSLSYCYATGDVNGQKVLGGLVGTATGPVTCCYSTGAVQAAELIFGGLICDSAGGTTFCFWDIETSGTVNGIGRGASTGVTGKTTAEMKTQTTFTDAGWDFADMWFMPFTGYPHLMWDKYFEGSGTETDPYQIGSIDDLYHMMGLPEDWNQHFVLTADLDLAGETFTKALIAPDTSPLLGFQGTVFSGVFDGGGHRIRNLTVNASSYAGLFGFLGEDSPRSKGGTVKNLALINVNIQGGSYTGSIAGMALHADIIACYAAGTLSGSGDYAGGLAGYLGANDSLLGMWHSTLSDCYSRCSVSGSNYVGGLIGYNYKAKVIHSYSTGPITGSDNTGGFCGAVNSGGNYEDIGNFWDINTSLTETSAMGQGKATKIMRNLSIYTSAGWDFTATWAKCSGHYPRLQSLIPAADFICPDGAAMEDFAYLAARWMRTDCASTNNCEGADLNRSGDIGINDLITFADNWLE